MPILMLSRRLAARQPRATAFGSGTDDRTGVLFVVPGVECVVRPFDEDLAPLDEAGGEECRDHADQDFLQKGRMHCPFCRAGAVPWAGFMPAKSTPSA